MMVGSAKDAMICLESISSPMFSPLKGISALSETVRHIMVIIPSDVAQEGIHSVSHDKVANTKIAMMRCCTMVRPSMPKVSIGKFQTMAVTTMITKNWMIFFLS